MLGDVTKMYSLRETFGYREMYPKKIVLEMSKKVYFCANYLMDGK